MSTSVHDLGTPALIVDVEAFEQNVTTMTQLRPGLSLRPHVKAFKSTDLAARLAAVGHTAFCCATVREMAGMAQAGLAEDLLLANETLDVARLQQLTSGSQGRFTVAVDSDETIAAAAKGGIREVLIDVNVGLPRCGCDPADAGHLADTARAAGLEVRGVMGYEGHLMMVEQSEKTPAVEAAMELLLSAHDMVGGDIVSGGGTGTSLINRWCTELQAGSYTLMDSDYGSSGLPFRQALHLWCSVISVNRQMGYAVLDGGLKSLSLDHGNPRVEGGEVWFCSDEHITYSPEEGRPLPKIGDKVRVVPSHVDPTVAYHDRMHLIDGDRVIDTWAVDLRDW
ncbi:MAG TPA: alanine racemase [Microthrixaceae bacterium]|nr:alanine racemase [Microthrixaceae bacterium]